MTTSARELSARLSDLLRDERAALAEFLLALADFDRLRLWVDLGYSSLFDYLHRELGMSKGAAFYRLTAAQVIQRHPAVVEPLRDGRLCLTTIVELSKVLTAENLEDVLPRFFHLSKREAQEVRVELRPEPSVPARTIVTPVRSSPADLGFAPSGDLRQPAVHPANHLDANSATQAQEGPPPAERSRMTVEPKTAEESRLHITVPRRLLRKLEQARDALSHSHPGATEEAILEVGLDLILERAAKRRGLVAKPRKGAPDRSATTPRDGAPEPTRYVPAEIRRAVWRRDGGRCQWPVEGGGVCGSTLRVELDHIPGWALGGPPTVEKLRCLCRVHNDLAARQVHGHEWINRFTRGVSQPFDPAAAAE